MPGGAGISWKDSMEFCSKLTQREEKLGILKDCVYSLPTEAQWEYSCRAGSSEDYSVSSTHSYKFAQVNAFGLFGMHDGGWEWCLDRWHDNYQGAPTDERAWLTVGKWNRELRVSRGGVLGNGFRSSTSSMRKKYNERTLYSRTWIRIILISKAAHAELVDSTLLGFEE